MNSQKNEVEGIIARMKESLSARSDMALAKFFGSKSSGYVSNWRKKGDVPEGNIALDATTPADSTEKTEPAPRRLTLRGPHDLRHAAGTDTLEATGDIRAVQDVLGHADLKSTMRYTKIATRRQQRIAEQTAALRKQLRDEDKTRKKQIAEEEKARKQRTSKNDR